MIKKSFQNLWEKAGKEPWLSGLNNLFLALFIFFSPTQLGKHFWPPNSFVSGIRIDYLSPTLYFSDALIIGLIILNLKNFRIAIVKIKIEKTKKYLGLMFVLFLIGSILFSPTPILGIYYLIKIIEFVALGFVFLVNAKKLMDYFYKILPFSIILESVLGIAEFLNKGSLNGIFYFLGERGFSAQTPQIANASINGQLILRPYSTFSHPNVLAAFLVLSITILIISLNSKNRRFNYWNLFAIGTGIIALILTFSRTAIVVFIISRVLIMLKNYVEKKSIKKYLLGILTTVFLISISIVRFRFIPNFEDSSFIDRKDLIIASFKMIKTHPIFGVGLNNFLSELPRYFKGSEDVFYIQPVHNGILLAASQLGIFPVLILLYFISQLFIKTNFWGKLLLFQVLFLSLFDHYFLTIQQGQILLVLSLSMAIILVGNARINEDAQRDF